MWGFMLVGVFLNEVIVLYDLFVKEVIFWCFYKGVVVMMDINFENLMYIVKIDYIDKDG